MKTSLLRCALAIVATAAALAAASPTLPVRGSVTAAPRAQGQVLAKPAVPVHARRLPKERAPRAAHVATRLQKNTPNLVKSLAMDGPRIAYDVASSYPGKRCNGVYVWNVANGATARVSGAGSCGNEGSSTGAGVREVAVAGPRVAWIVNEGGNTYHKDYLYSAALPRPKEHLLASAYREGEGEGTLTCGQPHPTSVGKWIGCLVGARTVLMVNRWSTGNSGRITSARLDSIGKRLREITSGTGSMDALSTDGGQVAVVRRHGTVALYSARDGSLLRVVSTSAAEAAVGGNDLVVLTSTGELEVRNSHSGGLLHKWPLAAGARFLDVCRGLASYAAPLHGGYGAHAVHVIRLSSGEDRIVARHPYAWTTVGDVQLEPAGLAYDVSVGRASDRGAVVFLPMSSLR
jgi:hypothetical protein